MPEPVQPAAAPIFMGLDEAAALLNVSEHWLRKAVRNRAVAHSKLSDRVVRFTAEDIAAIREQSRVEPEQAPQASKSAAPTPSRRRAS